MVALNILGNIGREQTGAGVSGMEPVPKFSSGDIFVDGRKEVDAGALGWSERKRLELELRERKLGTAHDDPTGKREQRIWFPPSAKSEKAIRSGEHEEGCSWVFKRKSSQGIDGVVGRSVGMWRVDGGGSESAVSC
jgi:hypothetical protein